MSPVPDHVSSVDDLNATMEGALKDPRLYAHARRTHDSAIVSVYEATETNVSNRRKRKRDDLTPSDQDPLELVELRKQLNTITLQSWPFVSLFGANRLC